MSSAWVQLEYCLKHILHENILYHASRYYRFENTVCGTAGISRLGHHVTTVAPVHLCNKLLSISWWSAFLPDLSFGWIITETMGVSYHFLFLFWHCSSLSLWLSYVEASTILSWLMLLTLSFECGMMRNADHFILYLSITWPFLTVSLPLIHCVVYQ